MVAGVTPRILHVLELQQRLADEELRTLVDRFYERVQADALLGPVFAARIATDGWPRHLDKMAGFWSTILRGSNRYHGDPMAVHRALPDLSPAHFDRWLGLFREVTAELFDDEVAASIVQRAERMANRMQA